MGNNTQTIEITQILAIIGAITGIIGTITGILALILNFLELKSKKPKIKINIDKYNSFYIKNIINSETNKINCEYFAIIKARITNVSINPTTLDELKIEEKRNCNNHAFHVHDEHNDYSRNIYNVQLSDNSLLGCDISSPVTLPQKIDVGESLDVKMIFPFYDKLVFTNNILNVKTSVKEYKISIQLHEYEVTMKRQLV